MCDSSSDDPTSFISALYSDMGYVTAFAHYCSDPENFTALTPHQRRGLDAGGFLTYCPSNFMQSNRTSYFDLFRFQNHKEIWGPLIPERAFAWFTDLHIPDLLITFENQYRDLLRFYLGAFLQAHTDLFLDQARLDEQIANTLETIDLNNSIVVLFSDHGIHYGTFLLFRFNFFVSLDLPFDLFCVGPRIQTRQGQVDNKWPFLSLSIPNHILDRFPLLTRNLEENQYRLVTAYDLHTTLRHFLSYPVSSPSASLNGFGRSLLDPIAPDRNCTEAGIPFRMCSCLPWAAVNSSAPFYESVVNASRQVFRSCVSVPLSRLKSSKCRIPDAVSVDFMVSTHHAASWDGRDETLVRSRTHVVVGNRSVVWDLEFSLLPFWRSAPEDIEHDVPCAYWSNHAVKLQQSIRYTKMLSSERIRSDNKIFESPIWCMKDLSWS